MVRAMKYLAPLLITSKTVFAHSRGDFNDSRIPRKLPERQLGRGDKCYDCPWSPFIDESHLTDYKICPFPDQETCHGFQEESFIMPEIELFLPSSVQLRNNDDYSVPSVDIKVTTGNLFKVSCGGRNPVDQGCWEWMGVGSGGMSSLGCDSTKCNFITISDNGMIRKCPDGEERGYFVPEFGPFIAEISLDRSTGEILPVNFQNLFTTTGSATITGLPNADPPRSFRPVSIGETADQTGSTCEGDATVTPSADAMDPEGIQRIETPQRQQVYVIVEENSPSIAFIDAQGRVLIRYVPDVNIADLGLNGANYKVEGILPEAYFHRRAGKGFEGIACNQISTPEGQIVDGFKCWAFMQAPLLDPNLKDDQDNPVTPVSAETDEKNANKAYVYRVVELDFESGILTAEVTAEYLIEATVTPRSSFEELFNPDSLWADKNIIPQDLSIRGAMYLEGCRFVVIESARDQVLYWAVDLKDATNILDKSYAQVEALYEDQSITKPAINTLRDNGIFPGKKRLIAHSATIQGWPKESPPRSGLAFPHPSGVALIGDSLITIGDNEFGINFDKTRVLVSQINSACNPLPVQRFICPCNCAIEICSCCGNDDHYLDDHSNALYDDFADDKGSNDNRYDDNMVGKFDDDDNMVGKFDDRYDDDPMDNNYFNDGRNDNNDNNDRNDNYPIHDDWQRDDWQGDDWEGPHDDWPYYDDWQIDDNYSGKSGKSGKKNKKGSYSNGYGKSSKGFGKTSKKYGKSSKGSVKFSKGFGKSSKGFGKSSKGYGYSRYSKSDKSDKSGGNKGAKKSKSNYNDFDLFDDHYHEGDFHDDYFREDDFYYFQNDPVYLYDVNAEKTKKKGNDETNMDHSLETLSVENESSENISDNNINTQFDVSEIFARDEPANKKTTPPDPNEKEEKKSNNRPNSNPKKTDTTKGLIMGRKQPNNIKNSGEVSKPKPSNVIHPLKLPAEKKGLPVEKKGRPSSAFDKAENKNINTSWISPKEAGISAGRASNPKTNYRVSASKDFDRKNNHQQFAYSKNKNVVTKPNKPNRGNANNKPRNGNMKPGTTKGNAKKNNQGGNIRGIKPKGKRSG